NPRKTKRFWMDFKNIYGFLFGILLGMIGLVFAFVGYYYEFSAPYDFTDILYKVLRLFVFEHLGATPDSWQLVVALYICPFATYYSVAFTFFYVFRNRIKMLRIRFLRNHIIICGLNKRSACLATDFYKAKKKIVIITDDLKNQYANKMEDLGIHLIEGNSSDPFILNKAGVIRAETLIAFTEDDTKNMEITINAEEIVEKRRTTKKKLFCYTHIFDKKMYDAFSKREIFYLSHKKFESKLFNTYQNDARLLFLTYPFEEIVDETDGIDQVHILLIGFGNLGETIFLQAAQMGHYRNNKSINLTVLGEKKECWTRFLYQYPGLKKIKELTSNSFDYNFDKIKLEDIEALESKINDIHKTLPITALVLCLENEEKSIKLSLNLMEIFKKFNILLRLPLAIYLDENEDLAKLGQNILDEDEKSSDVINKFDIKPYGLITQSCSKEIIAQENLDRIAKMIHEVFLEGEKDKLDTDETKSKFGKPWEKLPEVIRKSNRLQADHMIIKIRTLKARVGKIVAKGEEFELGEDDLSTDLAIMEHNRWCAERWVEGWKYGKEKDKLMKINPALVPYAELHDDEVKKDKSAVNTITKSLELINLKLLKPEKKQEKKPVIKPEVKE
ncbi:MAG: NAD-binding protein, partial [Promethearchaeota archaeon]